MGDQAFLRRHHQIGRQQQQTVGARFFRSFGQFDRDGRAIAAARDHRRLAGAFLHRRRDDLADFLGREREDFAGAAGGEQAGQALEAEQPGAMLAIGAFLELEALIKMGDRKGQQALCQDIRHLGGRHLAHSSTPAVAGF